MGRPTRNDVAKYANTSGATVSRVLSGRDDIPIAPETRAKVLEAVAKLGYQPNSAARALNKGRSDLIGFWMSLHYSRYRAQVLDAMRTRLSKTEMALAVTDVDEEYQWDRNFSRALRLSVDGIIAFDNSISLEAFAARRDRLAPQTPFVSMGAFWSESLSYVGIDLRKGATLAMRHLMETGRRRIAYMAPFDSGLTDSGPRYEAYSEAMQEAGFELETILTNGDDVQGALKLRSGALPDAILCMNDDLAISASSALILAGVRPGQEVALVGFDGIKETRHGLCPITTVCQPFEEMCELAIEFLQAQMEDPSAPLMQRVLTPQLIVRESSLASN